MESQITRDREKQSKQKQTKKRANQLKNIEKTPATKGKEQEHQRKREKVIKTDYYNRNTRKSRDVTNPQQ